MNCTGTGTEEEDGRERERGGKADGEEEKVGEDVF